MVFSGLVGIEAMANNDKVIGVIGGMGPDATVDFMSRVLAATPASEDQDHVRMVVEHNPRIPSRQLAMRGAGLNPGPVMAAMAARLEVAGADFLVMPCNTAHAWQSDIVAAIRIPFVSIVDVSVAAASDLSAAESAVGLMTTPGCFESGLYQQALTALGHPVINQTADELAATMSLIDRIKGGDKSDDVAVRLRALGNELIARGAGVLIAACTELPLVLKPSMFEVAFVSSTDVLAEKAVALALGGSE